MKRRVMNRLRRGLITVSEAALIAEVDKSTVSRWCDAAKIDAGAARLQRILEMRRADDHAARGDGVRDDVELEHHPRTGPSKAALRQQAEWAMRRAGRGEEPGEADHDEAPDPGPGLLAPALD
jgi:hypothetical protein